MGNNNNYKNGQKNYQTQNTGNQITASILILSVILSFTLGIIGGYLIGESRTEKRISNSAINIVQPNNQDNNSGDSSNDIQQSVDYSKYVINAKKGTTVENFYGDAESKMYASALIGTSMPTITWEDSTGKKHSTSDFGDGKYIIEIFSPTCTFCNSSIPVVDDFRKNNDIPLVSLTTTTDGDISAFNADGENAFVWKDITSENNELLNYVPWIPTFLYVENGQIQLVTYGGVNAGDLENYIGVAYDK